MSESVNLVFITTSEFKEDCLKEYAQEWKATIKRTTNAYQRLFWSINGLSIILYENKLVVQGRLNEFTKRFIKGLRNIKGLTLDSKNLEKFMRIFPVKQNSVVCSTCGEDSLLIKGYIEGLDIVFGMECSHKTDLVAPFLTLSNRILPDVNMLISKSVSRLINLGCLKGVEIVFPEFILDVIDTFKASPRKKAVSDELSTLRRIEEKGLIKINTFSSIPIHLDAKPPMDEDRIILDFAHFTNSILLTGDGVFKDRAIMSGRPTIFVSPEDYVKLKMLEETRT